MILKLSKLLLLTAVVIFAGTRLLRADNSANATYGFISETYPGIDFGSTSATDTDRGFFDCWFGGGEIVMTKTEYLYYTEGSEATVFCTAFSNGRGGFTIAFGTSDTNGAYEMDRNFGAYAGGSIEFDIMLSTVTGVSFTDPINIHPSDIHLQLHWDFASGTPAVSDDRTLATLCPSLTTNGNWQHCSIPFSAFKDTDYGALASNNYAWVPNGTTWYFDNSGSNDGIKHVDDMVFSVNIASAQFFIDNLVWKKPGTGSMNVSLINRTTGAAASNLTWSGVNLGATRWQPADQCIQVQTDYFDSPTGLTWGIQIFTNNNSTAANPRYTGTGNPVGLVNQSTTTQVLPVCWRIVDTSTNTLTAVTGSDNKIYSNELGGQASNFPCFLWMEDRSTSGFSDGADYVTVWDARGIHYSEASWGGAVAPNYIYIEADFTNGKTPCVYNTSTLSLELFHE